MPLLFYLNLTRLLQIVGEKKLTNVKYFKNLINIMFAKY